MCLKFDGMPLRRSRSRSMFETEVENQLRNALAAKAREAIDEIDDSLGSEEIEEAKSHLDSLATLLGTVEVKEKGILLNGRHQRAQVREAQKERDAEEKELSEKYATRRDQAERAKLEGMFEESVANLTASRESFKRNAILSQTAFPNLPTPSSIFPTSAVAKLSLNVLTSGSFA